AIAAALTDQISRGLGLPPDRVEIVPPGSIPKTSSGKLRREETRKLFMQGTLATELPPAWLQIARLGAGSAIRSFGKMLGKGIVRALEMLYGIYFVVVFLLWIVPSWAIVHFINDHRAAGRFTSSSLKILFTLMGCRVRVVGKEYMNTPGAKMYASNHT